MAEKPRVRAPKQRKTVESHSPGKNRRVVLAVAAAGLVAVGIFAVVALAGIGGSTDARAALTKAGCTLKVAPAGPPSHSIQDAGGSSAAWNTDPPTSGPHYAEAAIFQRYDEPLEQARVIHNLEHGGIFVQYGNDVPDSTVKDLEAFWNDHKPGTILAPYPKLGDKIAIGAWVLTPEELASGDNGNGYLAKCTTFDDAAFSAFFDEFQFRGSHGNDPSVLQPGH